MKVAKISSIGSVLLMVGFVVVGSIPNVVMNEIKVAANARQNAARVQGYALVELTGKNRSTINLMIRLAVIAGGQSAAAAVTEKRNIGKLVVVQVRLDGDKDGVDAIMKRMRLAIEPEPGTQQIDVRMQVLAEGTHETMLPQVTKVTGDPWDPGGQVLWR